MDSSSPTPPDSGEQRSRRERLDTVAAQVAALDELILLARRSIRVFDVDLSQMGWNSPARTEALAAFLRRSRHAKLYIILHETRHVEGHCARLQLVHRRFAGAVSICRTGPEARHARDPLAIVDDRHYLHRLDFEQPVAVLGIEQPDETGPLLNRFEEIWATRESCLPGSLLGM